MSAGANDAFLRVFTAWEKAAGEVSAELARDPQFLAFGASMLRAHLVWRRAAQTAWEAALAPWQSLAPSPPSDASGGKTP